MKKALLITLDFPPVRGGVAAYWAGLGSGLSADEFAVLTLPAFGSETFDKEQSYYISRKKLLARYIWPHWLPLFWQVWKTLKKTGAEKILVGQILPIGTVAYIFKKLFGMSYIVSLHGLDFQLTKQSARKRRLANLILQSAESIVVNSEATKKLVLAEKADWEKKITVVYPCPKICPEPCDELMAESLREKYALQGKKVILSVGRLVERKGFDQVIRASAEVKKSLPEAKTIILGSGPDRERLTALIAELGLENDVLLLAPESDRQIAGFYSLCSLFAMPSRELPNGDVEGFGIVFLEANAFGRPVIGGRSGGVAEAVAEGVSGLLVDPLSVQELTDTILMLLKDEGLAGRLGENGRKRVLERFGWGEQAGRVKNVLG